MSGCAFDPTPCIGLTAALSPTWDEQVQRTYLREANPCLRLRWRHINALILRYSTTSLL